MGETQGACASSPLVGSERPSRRFSPFDKVKWRTALRAARSLYSLFLAELRSVTGFSGKGWRIHRPQIRLEGSTAEELPAQLRMHLKKRTGLEEAACACQQRESCTPAFVFLFQSSKYWDPLYRPIVVGECAQQSPRGD